VIRYIGKKAEDHTNGEARAQSTPPRKALGSDGSDTPPSWGATQSGPPDEGNTDEVETSHTPPRGVPWSQQADTAEAGTPRVTLFNTYHFVRLVDLEKADLTEKQDNKGNMADTLPTWPTEHNMDTDEEPSDMPQRKHMAR